MLVIWATGMNPHMEPMLLRFAEPCCFLVLPHCTWS